MLFRSEGSIPIDPVIIAASSLVFFVAGPWWGRTSDRIGRRRVFLVGQLGYVLGGSLLTEVVFSYPGQGYLLVQAVRSQDYPLMQGIFLFITLAVLAANWLVDLATWWLDARTRESAS